MKKSILETLVRECAKQINEIGSQSMGVESTVYIQDDQIKKMGEDKFFAVFPTLQGKVNVADVDFTVHVYVHYNSTPYKIAKHNPVDSSYDAEGGDFEITSVEATSAEMFVFDRKSTKTSKVQLKLDDQKIGSYIDLFLKDLPRNKEFVDTVWKDIQRQYQDSDL